MEDDKIKELFADFQPDLASDFDFFNRLNRNLDAVEVIKQRTEQQRRRGYRAVVWAAFAGFVAGFIFSLALPYIGGILENLTLNLAEDTFLYDIVSNYQLISWLAVGATSSLIALNTYRLSLATSK